MGVIILQETKRTLGYEASDMDGCFEKEILARHPTLDGVFVGTTSNNVTTIGEVCVREDLEVDDLVTRFGQDAASSVVGCIPYGARAEQIVERDEDGDPSIRTPYLLHQVERPGAPCQHRWESPKVFEAICAELETRMERREIIFGAFVTQDLVFTIERDLDTDEVRKHKGANDDAEQSEQAVRKIRRAH